MTISPVVSQPGDPQAPAIIEVRDLVKRFGALAAVDGVSLQVRRGEVFGILGPNGAGKTTLLEIVEGLQEPSAGSTTVLGHDSRREVTAMKQRIGVQLQASAYFDQLTLVEILALFADWYKRSVPAAQLLAQVGLTDKARSTVVRLSGGQKQRFTIAAALVNAPDVVFLDEPTTGLDPQARHNLWDIIRQVHAQGRTIVLTTHYMEEAETLCHRVAIMDHGKLVALDTPANLVRLMHAPYRVRVSTSGALDLSGSGADDVTRTTDGYAMHTTDALATVRAIETVAGQQGVTIAQIEVRPATLEDVFLSLTGHALRE